jgi:hypothetical protein
MYVCMVKAEVVPVLFLTEHHAMRAYWGSGSVALTSAIEGGDRSASCPGSFTLRETATGTHWIGD